MELEEDGGYCTLSPTAEVMLQGGEGGRGTLSKVKSLGREGLHGSELVKLFFLLDLSLKQDAENCYLF